MSDNKKSFLMYHEYKDLFKDLSDEEFGKLMRLAFDYEIENKEPNNLDRFMQMAFTVIKNNLDRDRLKYDRRCETSAENGKKGGRPKKPNLKPNEKPKKSKKADNDNENENDNDNVNDTDNEDDNITLFEIVEENFGRTLSPYECEEVSTWEDNDLTRYAIKQAILNRACSVKYISRILYSYKQKNILTVDEAIKSDNEYLKTKNNNPPEWFDKEPVNEEITEEEKNELENILSTFKD